MRRGGDRHSGGGSSFGKRRRACSGRGARGRMHLLCNRRIRRKGRAFPRGRGTARGGLFHADNADKLNGQSADYYAKATDVKDKFSQLTNDGAVQYTSQSLSNEQKAQARSNINAEEAGISYTKSEIDTKLDEKINAFNGKFTNSLSATTEDGTQLYQESMRVGGLGTGNCVSINKTGINFYNKSGTLGLNVDASRIRKLATPSDDTDAANKKYVDDAVAGIIVPTKTSELTNDSGFITSSQGVENAGKFLVVGNDGNITLKTLEAWQGGNY